MKIFIILFLAVLFFFLFNPVFAEDVSLSARVFTGNEIGISKITPASPFYFLKTIREEFEKYFAKVPKVKFMRSLEFATRRLREVRSLITVKREDLVEPNLERYWFYISSLPDKDLEDKELGKRIEESLVVHTKTLTKIYPQFSNLRAKMSIRSVLSKMTQRADLPNYAKLPVCEFFAKEATQSADLNETERVILLERAEKCRKSYTAAAPSNR